MVTGDFHRARGDGAFFLGQIEKTVLWLKLRS